MRRFLVTLVLACALLAACGKHATEPPPPVTVGGPPALVASQPPARATFVLYDSDIWAQFDRALDGTTVTAQTVFLKLDGQRSTVTVGYDGISRRVLLHPTTPLELQRTYTVDLTSGIKGTDGTPLPAGVFFQFTTNSLRRVVYDYPAQGALEGPVACLGWGGTKGPDGNILYEVYASPDSEAVARRTVPFLQRAVFTRLLPSAAWPLGQNVFWAVTSENVTTHERMEGAIHQFRTLDAATPLDSVVILAHDHASNDIRNANTQFCSNTVLPSGPRYNAALHWNSIGFNFDARLASVTMKLYFTDANAGTFNTMRPSAWLAQNDWIPCTVRAPGPPYSELAGLLANAVPADSIESDFTSDRLSAFFEAQYRRRTLVYGTLIRTLDNANFHSAAAFDAAKLPRIVVRFYHLPPGAAR